MGRRLDGFDIELTFDPKGEVESLRYSDGDGCGHSHEVTPETPLAQVVEYHLRHYKRSHRMEPTKMCNFVLLHPHVVEIEYHCSREPHIGDDHELVPKYRR